MGVTVDEAKLGEFMGRMVGYMTGGAMCFSIWLGDELGLYRVLAGAGPLKAEPGGGPDRVSSSTGARMAGRPGRRRPGRLGPASDTYELTAEAAMALADENSPVFVARGMNAFASMFLDKDKITAAFKGDGALAWGEHHPACSKGPSGSSAPVTGPTCPPTGCRPSTGVDAKLQAGATVADIGCGHGASVVVMAQAYPNSRIRGFDFHAPSIETARARAAEAGVAERTTFEVADAKGYAGQF